MSEDSQAPAPVPPGEADEFPTPRHFVLSPVKDGNYQKALPTITAVYIGADDQPDGHFLMGMTGVSLDPHESDPARLLLHLFIQPEDETDEELQVFTDTCGYEIAADLPTVQEFWESVGKVKCFTLAISCDEYYFKCRVDTESTACTEVRIDWRLLN